jgi:hypothetical protein
VEVGEAKKRNLIMNEILKTLKPLLLILFLFVQQYCFAQNKDASFYKDCQLNIEACIKAIKEIPSLKEVLQNSLNKTEIESHLLEGFFDWLEQEEAKNLLNTLNSVLGKDAEKERLYLTNRGAVLEYIFVYQELDLVIKKASSEEVLAYIYDSGFATDFFLEPIKSRGLNVDELNGMDVALTLTSTELNMAFKYIYQRLLEVDKVDKYDLLIKLNRLQ